MRREVQVERGERIMSTPEPRLTPGRAFAFAAMNHAEAMLALRQAPHPRDTSEHLEEEMFSLISDRLLIARSWIELMPAQDTEPESAQRFVTEFVGHLVFELLEEAWPTGRGQLVEKAHRASFPLEDPEKATSYVREHSFVSDLVVDLTQRENLERDTERLRQDLARFEAGERPEEREA